MEVNSIVSLISLFESIEYIRDSVDALQICIQQHE